MTSSLKLETRKYQCSYSKSLGSTAYQGCTPSALLLMCTVGQDSCELAYGKFVELMPNFDGLFDLCPLISIHVGQS